MILSGEQICGTACGENQMCSMPPIVGVVAPMIAALRMLIFFSFFTLSVFFAAIFVGDVFFTGLIDTGS